MKQVERTEAGRKDILFPCVFADRQVVREAEFAIALVAASARLCLLRWTRLLRPIRIHARAATMLVRRGRPVVVGPRDLRVLLTRKTRVPGRERHRPRQPSLMIGPWSMRSARLAAQRYYRAVAETCALAERCWSCADVRTWTGQSFTWYGTWLGLCQTRRKGCTSLLGKGSWNCTVWLHLPAANALVLNTNKMDKSNVRTTNDDRDDASFIMARLLGDVVGLCSYGCLYQNRIDETRYVKLVSVSNHGLNILVATSPKKVLRRSLSSSRSNYRRSRVVVKVFLATI